MVITNSDKESKKARYKILYIDIKEFEKEFRKTIELTYEIAKRQGEEELIVQIPLGSKGVQEFDLLKEDHRNFLLNLDIPAKITTLMELFVKKFGGFSEFLEGPQESLSSLERLRGLLFSLILEPITLNELMSRLLVDQYMCLGRLFLISDCDIDTNDVPDATIYIETPESDRRVLIKLRRKGEVEIPSKRTFEGIMELYGSIKREWRETLAYQISKIKEETGGRGRDFLEYPLRYYILGRLHWSLKPYKPLIGAEEEILSLLNVVAIIHEAVSL